MSSEINWNSKHILGFILFILLILFLHCTYRISIYERKIQEMQALVNPLPGIVTTLEKGTDSKLEKMGVMIWKNNERLGGELEELKNELEDLKGNK